MVDSESGNTSSGWRVLSHITDATSAAMGARDDHSCVSVLLNTLTGRLKADLDPVSLMRG